MLVAELLNLAANLIANLAHTRDALVVGAGELGWVGERPMEPPSDTRKDGATLSPGPAANRDDVRKKLAGAENVEDALRLLAGNVYADLLQRFDNERVQCARL